MKYDLIAQILSKLEATTKRLEMTSILTEFLKTVKPDELDKVILLLRGTVFPEYREDVIGIADKLMIKILARASGRSEDEVVSEWKKIGDLGKVSEEFMIKRKQITLTNETLSVNKVFSNLLEVTRMEGKGSVDRKAALISELLTNANPTEARYITRTILGTLRVGMGAGTLRDAIAQAYNCDKELLEKAYNLTADYANVASIAAREGNEGLKKIGLQIGSPAKSMLYQKETNINDAFERVGKPAAIEYKYDGLRLQVHKKDGEVKLFTRNLDDVTKMFPEVISAVKENVKGSCIIEGEGVGYNPTKKSFKPFQEISKRIKRKYEVEQLANETPVVLFLFDLFDYEGTNYLDKPFKERNAKLKTIIKQVPWKIELAKQIISSDEKEVDAFYKEALSKDQEGIMMKNLDAPYKPGSRVGYGIKIKPIKETLDLAISGAEWGTGKRSKWLSSFTLACKKDDDYLDIGKMGTGLNEKEFAEVTEKLKPLITSEDGKEVRVKPIILVEIGYEEIQKSPTYGSGYALRFPRLIRFRDD
ncbi:MAG TPA: ATP-dependent DNA ligase, partial [Candidatus Nanoarchaeia archaeon]|nr:ATP-dependent DNA ligase [Candidatus Nanoarchaeia archaeon]